MKKTLAFVLLCLMQVAAVSAQESNVVKSTGHIGPYEVTMFIDTDYTKEGDEVGYYYYNDRPNTHFKLVMRECIQPSMHREPCSLCSMNARPRASIPAPSAAIRRTGEVATRAPSPTARVGNTSLN